MSTNPGEHAPAEPDLPAPAEPDLPAPAEPDLPAPAEPDLPAPAEPYLEAQRAEPYPEEQRAAVYRVIGERRDVREGFRPDPVPDDVLRRVLGAAHQAPSVGFSQPWDFIVITERPQRERIAALARRNRDGYAAALPGARSRAFGRPRSNPSWTPRSTSP